MKQRYYVEYGVQYQAKIIDVPFFAGSGTIKSKLTDAGFVEASIQVWKKSGDWWARGRWGGETGEVELDDHIDASTIVRI